MAFDPRTVTRRNFATIFAPVMRRMRGFRGLGDATGTGEDLSAVSWGADTSVAAPSAFDVQQQALALGMANPSALREATAAEAAPLTQDPGTNWGAIFAPLGAAAITGGAAVGSALLAQNSGRQSAPLSLAPRPAPSSGFSLSSLLLPVGLVGGGLLLWKVLSK